MQSRSSAADFVADVADITDLADECSAALYDLYVLFQLLFCLIPMLFKWDYRQSTMKYDKISAFAGFDKRLQIY